MERGVYFDGWYKHNHCYHPSLPIRTLQMLEDLKRYHGTILVWAGMGGGSISLPYLEQEAFGEVDVRQRFYGAMNDSEFAHACGELGIKLFGIVFEVQGWEFPAVFDENGRIIRLNLHAEVPGHEWYGLREFSQGKYPNAFRTKLEDYYPDGITNSLGEKVTDLWEECAARDRFGVPVHSEWVEVKGHEHQAYQMCRNNPVWRDYLKKIMMIQIDAGVQGIQLDECELPMSSIGSGGCFCKDCMREFTEYLVKKRDEGKLSSEWDGIDVDHFNYKEYLLEHDSPYPEGAPFFKEYWEYQVTQVRRYFGELADFARDYAMEKYGRKVEVSGNFYNLQPAYHPIVPKADIIITEMEHSLFRQPYFYRYSAGFAEGKTVIIAENPYRGIVPELVKMLDQGKGYDLYRIFMLEASVYGCNMSVPFGSWMGNTIKDAFWPPRSLTCQIQDFLFEHDDFFPRTPAKGAAVLYSYGSNYWRDAHRGGDANQAAEEAGMINLDATTSEWAENAKPMPFWDLIRRLSAANAVYDVKMLPDGELREDDFDAEQLEPYPLLILPDCWSLTDSQAAAVLQCAEAGKKILVYGSLAEGTDLADRLASFENVFFVSEGMDALMAVFTRLYGETGTLFADDPRIGMHRFDTEDKTFVHILNYDYCKEKDAILPIDEVKVALRDLPGSRITVYHLDGQSDSFACEQRGDDTVITLTQVPVYTVITIE